MAKKKIGNQKPTQSLILSTKNSDYKEAIEKIKDKYENKKMG